MTTADVDADDPDAAADYLYGLPVGDFVSARTALVAAAKRSGAREAATQIGALRKPTVAAWAINLLARRRPDVVRDLLSLAERLRSAHTRLDATALRELRGERDDLLARFVTAAVEEAQHQGQTLSQSTRDDIHDTAVAGIADAVAGSAIDSRTLTRALHYSGFGEVDVADAVARTSTGVALAVLDGGRSDRADPPGHRGDAARAAAAQRAAEREAAARERREQQRLLRDEARAEVVQARRRVSELVRELAQANDDLAQAEVRVAELDLDAE